LLKRVYKGNKVLSFDDFKTALSNVPKDVQVHFSAFSEPFINPDAHKMVKYACEQGYEVVVYTTTRGLNVKELEGLVFKEFHVHNIGNVQDVPYRTHFDTVDNPISRASNLFDTPAKENVKCSRNDFYKQNVMLPNGDVVLCCMDYGLKHKLGNLLETNFNGLKREDSYELCQKCEVSKYR
jgi:MoaA/NifB/PqqE/SkfB family radical SAM enzyme